MNLFGAPRLLTWSSLIICLYLAEMEIRWRKDDGKIKIQTNLDRQCPILIFPTPLILNYRDLHVFVHLYVQHIRPHLEFAVPEGSPCLERNKENLEKVQKRTVKMISGLKGHMHIRGEIERSGREAPPGWHDMIQSYKIVTGKDTVNNETWFKSVTVTGRATRSAADSLNLRPKARRLDTRRNFFSQRVVNWNNMYLPA